MIITIFNQDLPELAAHINGSLEIRSFTSTLAPYFISRLSTETNINLTLYLNYALRRKFFQAKFV